MNTKEQSQFVGSQPRFCSFFDTHSCSQRDERQEIFLASGLSTVSLVVSPSFAKTRIRRYIHTAKDCEGDMIPSGNA